MYIIRMPEHMIDLSGKPERGMSDPEYGELLEFKVDEVRQIAEECGGKLSLVAYSLFRVSVVVPEANLDVFKALIEEGKLRSKN